MLRAWLIVIAVIGVGCAPAKPPVLRVVGVHDVMFLEVTNPARHAVRLTRLQYTFEAAGAPIASGVVELSREVDAGGAVVVEVPVAPPSTSPVTLDGKLTTIEDDQIVRIFRVSAKL